MLFKFDIYELKVIEKKKIEFFVNRSLGKGSYGEFSASVEPKSWINKVFSSKDMADTPNIILKKWCGKIKIVVSKQKESLYEFSVAINIFPLVRKKYLFHKVEKSEFDRFLKEFG